MARPSKTLPARKPATASKPAASSKAPASSKTAVPTKAVAAPKAGAASKAVGARKAVAATPAPKVSKDDLRAQVEKLELAHATLRAKSRDMGKAAKAANTRIAELEAEVAQLQAQAERAAASAKRVKPAKPASAAPKSRRREIDPGDAVPPGVAVEEPEPMDQEAEAARDALEEHLSGE